MIRGETVLTGARHPGTELKVLHSPAGWYLGFTEGGMPYTRETEYFDNITTAQEVLSWFRRAS